jgi:uracil-DNA glycosylase family 4
MRKLLKEINACTICQDNLPLGCRPVVHVNPKSKILVIGQAPGIRVHQSGIPWDDMSGKNLRNWLNVDSDLFYDKNHFGIVPMGFCYPGTGKNGDLPPRKECAPLWHPKLEDEMNNVELVLLIGLYAQKYYLKKLAKKNLTETVRSFQEYLPNYLPLPHPSPRNNIWQKKNPWFVNEVLPTLRLRVSNLIKQ